MKKSVKIISTVMAGIMVLSSLSVTTVSAAKKKVKVGKPKITVANNTSGVKITWTKAKNAKKYVVQRKLSTAKKFTTVKTAKTAKAGSFVDKKAVAGKTYTYKVTAYNGKVSTASATKKIIRVATPTVVNNTNTMGYISLSVNGKIKGAKKYEVYRAVVKSGKTGKYVKVATLNNDGKSAYEDLEIVQGTFMFKLRAVNGSYKSDYSKAVKVDYIQAPFASAVISNDLSGVDVSWFLIPGIEGYRIYRSVNGEEKLVKEIKAADIDSEAMMGEYKDTDVEEDVTYQYTVKSFSGKKESDSVYSTAVVTFQTAKYYVQVGETSSAIVDEVNLMAEMFESLGYQYEIQVSVVSNDTSILEVDPTNNLVGVAEGKTEIVVTTTTTIDAMTTTTTEIYVVKVIGKS